MLRIARRKTSDESPERVWHNIADPRRWDRFWHDPDHAEVRRVKLVGAARPDVGAVVQVLYADLDWTRYRITAWRPDKQLELVAEAEGSGEGPGRAPRTARTERLTLIPQGGGSELEWSVRFPATGLGRLVAPLAVPRDAWAQTLEARLEATI